MENKIENNSSSRRGFLGGISKWLAGTAALGLLANVFTSNPLLLFFGIGLVGIVIAVLWIILSETGIVSGIISLFVKIFRFFRTTPGNVYSRIHNIYLGFNNRLSALVIGTKRIENNHRSFHKKVLLYSLGLGIWTFLGGLFVYASQDFGTGSDVVNGLLVPAGSTTVYDQILGKNAKRPFLHVRYRASETEDRRYKTWITGSAGGARTSDLDAMEVNFLSERAVCTLGANNFFLFQDA